MSGTHACSGGHEFDGVGGLTRPVARVVMTRAVTMATGDRTIRDVSTLMATRDAASVTRAGLIRVHPLGHCTAYPFRRDQVVIGRDPDADVHIGDDGVSRRHALVERRDGAWALRDL